MAPVQASSEAGAAPGPSLISAAGGSTRLNPQNPWPGLAAYDEASQAFFHGRSDDAAELLRLIRLTPLTVLYGKSGLGKSSLLQAGLFPRLRAEHYLPVWVRVDFSDRAECPPLEQVARRLAEEIAARGADGPPREPGEDLWQYLHRRDLQIWSADNYPLTPVLVFDQFEELFSRSGGNRERIGSVFHALADLIENRIPAELAKDAVSREQRSRLDLLGQRYHIVLAFREDLLPDIETWKDKVPSLLRNRLRLLPMSREQAIAATERAGAAVLEQGVAARIVDFVANRESDAAGAELAVEPVLLSLCCTQLNRRRAPQGRIDAALLASAGQDILQSFYDEALASMPERVPRFIEAHLIQGDRYRGSYPREEAIARGDLTVEELAALTDRHRLLRIDQQQGVARIELIHDRLVGTVRKARDERLAEEEKAQLERQAEEKRRAEMDRLEKMRLEAEAKAGRRFKRLAVGLALILIVALGLAIVAWWQWQNAEDLRAKAEQARDEANKARRVAEERTDALLKQFGWGTERLSKASVEQYSVQQSLQANQVLQQAARLAPRESRKAVTIQYFPKDVDEDKVESALMELGFTLDRKRAPVPGIPTNSIWYGTPVSIEDVKLVALTLIRAGVQIRAIRPFADYSPRKDAALIQVGADVAVVNDPPMSVEGIRDTSRFSR